MMTRFSKGAVLALVFLLAMAPPAQAAELLDKAAVEQIVKNYIMENPQVILDSVDGYQRKTREARLTEGLKKNKDVLVKDLDSPETGNPKGDVTVVEFFDYNCGYCKRAFSELKALLEKDKNVRVVFKEFPILGPTSLTASKWALAAHKQKKYFEFHTALMENKSPINDELLAKIAGDLGLDVNRMKTDAESADTTAQIEKSRNVAEAMGLSGTPAFVIGEEVVPGYIQLDRLETLLAKERSKVVKK